MFALLASLWPRPAIEPSARALRKPQFSWWRVHRHDRSRAGRRWLTASCRGWRRVTWRIGLWLIQHGRRAAILIGAALARLDFCASFWGSSAGYLEVNEHPPAPPGLDRRWIFLAIAVAVIIPMFFTVNLGGPSPAFAQALRDRGSGIKPGDIVMASMGTIPAPPRRSPRWPCGLPACPAARGPAGDCRPVAPGTDWPIPCSWEALQKDRCSRSPIEYGRDFLTLGYMVGGSRYCRAWAARFPRTFPRIIAHPDR